MREGGSVLPAAPEGFRWWAQERHGFAVALPRRFHLLGDTVDPVAQIMRGDDGDAFGGDHEFGEALFPHGFWDARVMGELEDRRLRPFRLFEFDMVGGRDAPQPEDERREMWFDARRMMPKALESGDLPGYRLLNVSDGKLGRLDALAFSYRWDGLSPFEGGGDHGLLVWAPTEWVVFHVYHHCPESQWDTRLAELATILGTFTPMGEAVWGNKASGDAGGDERGGDEAGRGEAGADEA